MFTFSWLITKNLVETVLEDGQHPLPLPLPHPTPHKAHRLHKTYTRSSNRLGPGRDEVGTSWGVSSGYQAEPCCVANPRPLSQSPDMLLCTQHTKLDDYSFQASTDCTWRLIRYKSGSHYISFIKWDHLFILVCSFVFKFNILKIIWYWLLSNQIVKALN